MTQSRRLLTRKCRWLSALLLLVSLALPANAVEPGEPAVTGPTVNVRDHGAIGDGVTNDTAAFRAAAKIIEEAGSGQLVIPAGVYIVGEQTHVPGKYPYYRANTIFSVRNVNGLIVDGGGATLRLAGGLRFGTFDKDTGKRFDPPAPFTDYDHQAAVGSMIAVQGSRNVLIRDLELDGNLASLELGGAWGDTGRQVAASGIWLYENSNVTVQNIHTHHHGLDGIMIGYTGLTEAAPPSPHLLINVVSEYNARQGLSWVGGRGLTAIRCKFNHTGRASFASAPGAGLDIEAESSVCRDGLFIECEFINNVGCGVVADSGDGGYSRFIRCTMWGTTAWSIWARKPGLVFEDSIIYGAIVHGFGSPDPTLATQYRRCHFEDREHPEFGVYRSAALVETSGADNMLFDACTFVANKTRAFYIDSGTRELIQGCTIIHRDPKPVQFASLVRGSHIEHTRFLEEYPEAATPSFIVADLISVGPGVTVSGPRCAWRHPNGTTGAIPPTDDRN